MVRASMHTKPTSQLGLLDSLMPQVPANDFLDRLEQFMNWQPAEKVLHAMYPATTGRPSQPP